MTIPGINIPGLPAVPENPVFDDPADAIWFILTNPCSAPFELFVITAINPALNAAIELIWIDAEDILSNYASPGAVKGSSPLGGKRGGRGKKGKGKSLNQKIGSWIDDILGHPLSSENLHWQQGQLHFWALYEILDRFLFAWMLMGVTDDFLIRWASLIYTETLNHQSCPRGLSAKGDGINCVPLFGWTTGYMPEETYNLLMPTWGTYFVVLPPGKWIVTFCQKKNTESATHVPVQMQIGLALTPDYLNWAAQSEIAEAPYGEVIDCVVAATVDGPATLIAAERCGGGTTLPYPGGSYISIKAADYVV